MANAIQHRTRVLLLGGTSEASELARHFAGDKRFDVILSLAGRTANPAGSPVPVRSGGFGGAQGLAAYLEDESIGVVLDATHPFAARISTNAIEASHRARVPLIALERPVWERQAGDNWQHYASVAEAIAALPHEPVRVFSGLGRLSLEALQIAPQHHWVIRVIDPLDQPLALPHAAIITARGPFKTQDDIAVFKEHAIKFVLAKNAGGSASYSKIEAARVLGLPVYMIDRPAIPHRAVVRCVQDAWAGLIAHHTSPQKRGV
ncbi:MAG: cobalt-precorrin-6A reductase [Hyphomicrobium sp.]